MESIIIPARLKSVRFPNKLLYVFNNGKTLLQTSWECAKKMGQEIGAEAYIATSDEEIADEANNWGAKVLLTEPCKSGSERVYKAAESLHLTGTIINWQGDVPFLPPGVLKKLIEELREEDDITTIHYESEYDSSPSIVKLVLGNLNKVLYFSRADIPYGKQKKKVHCGIYAYNMNTLKKLIELKTIQGLNEENLEQLSWLAHDYKVYSIKVNQRIWNIDLLEQAKEFDLCTM